MNHTVKYSLSKSEKERLVGATKAVLSIPFVDDLEDYIWESVFCYVKGIPLVDPLTSIRSKRLFDIVDTKKNVGWSAKAIQWNVTPGVEFELVIQRSDVMKKAQDLGFKHLDRNSPTKQLGAALLKHWYEMKVDADAEHQNVTDKRVCILLKSRDRKKFAYFEEDLQVYKPEDLVWRWTDESKTGLQGRRKSDDFCVFRWYPNQTQFFERFILPEDSFVYELNPKRVPLEEVVSLLSDRLNKL